MRSKVILVLITFIITLIITSCGNLSGSGEKIDVEQYREKVREQRQTGAITPEQRQDGIKSIFPNIKESSN